MKIEIEKRVEIDFDAAKLNGVYMLKENFRSGSRLFNPNGEFYYKVRSEIRSDKAKGQYIIDDKK